MPAAPLTFHVAAPVDRPDLDRIAALVGRPDLDRIAVLVDRPDSTASPRSSVAPTSTAIAGLEDCSGSPGMSRRDM